jgi:hypothetical protein
MRTIFDATSGQILFYYLIVIVLFIHTIYKFRHDSFFVLIIFIFFIGLFAYAGKSVQNIYRIVTVLYGLYLMQRTVKMKTFSGDQLIIISFVLFSLTFLLSSFMNKDYYTLMFSQYSRYLLMFLFYFILLQRIPNFIFQQKINQLLFHLILIQIMLSIVKMMVTGPMESIVGSLAYNGGANAAVIPILGFVFLWMYRKGSLLKNDWFFILGLVFIGFVNYKRAIWFILPFFMGLFMFYVQRRKIKRYLSILAILIPLIIYLGVRLNPTLNKEQKLWGSFDLKYVLNYTREYSFGKQETSGEQQVASGRGGAMTYLFTKMIGGDLSKTDIFGKGLALMYVEGAKNEETFAEEYNINSIGSASGFFQFYVVFGFLGTFCTLLFVYSLLRKVKNKRIQFALICMFFWEFFLYTGVMLREPALSFLFVYLIVYSNYLSLNPVQIRKSERFPEPQFKGIF